MQIKDHVFIIAEMSANHCGDKGIAKKIIKAAMECGADAVKVQTYTADTITIDCDSEIFRTSPGLWEGRTMHDLYQQAYMPWEWQGELKKYADELGIDFFSTPFDYTAVDFLESIGVSRYKIASPEAMDYPLIAYTAKHLKPMIISVGMSSLKEMYEAIDACKKVGNEDITLLKCTSEYPAKLERMNLLTIPNMIQRFGSQGVKIGLSDHSMNNETVIAAVALGARIIEKHLTLDRAMGGIDAGFSLNIEEFKSMVQAVRNTEKVLGEVNYSPAGIRFRGARSLFAVKDIKSGETFTAGNIRSIRPSNGLHPKYYPEILGKTAACDIAFGTPLTHDHVKEKLNLSTE
jgi:pseudaminic acid synthase